MMVGRSVTQSSHRISKDKPHHNGNARRRGMIRCVPTRANWPNAPGLFKGCCAEQAGGEGGLPTPLRKRRHIMLLGTSRRVRKPSSVRSLAAAQNLRRIFRLTPSTTSPTSVVFVTTREDFTFTKVP